MRPFIDPVRFAKKDGRKEVIERAGEYCLKIKERYGKYYEKLGISLDEVISELE
jgi:hypothetical protein